MPPTLPPYSFPVCPDALADFLDDACALGHVRYGDPGEGEPASLAVAILQVMALYDLSPPDPPLLLLEAPFPAGPVGLDDA